MFADIFIADSGRPINNGNAILNSFKVSASGNYESRFSGDNDFIKPSGYGGNVSVDYHASRFDDIGYYQTAHSGNYYGVPRDVRSIYI